METAGYDSSRPLAEQVAQRIKDYILEEKLKSGDKLPTETALAREMGVARSTVREAIKRLESQNILTVRHGAGSFVTDQPGLADDPLAPIITASVEVFTEGTHRTLLQETLDTHKAVLEAIKCGDSTWARDAMTLHLSYNRDLYRKMHRARSGEPPLAPKVPEWVLQLKELTKPEEPEEKE